MAWRECISLRKSWQSLFRCLRDLRGRDSIPDWHFFVRAGQKHSASGCGMFPLRCWPSSISLSVCYPKLFALAMFVSPLQNHDSLMSNITRRQFLEESILAAAAAASIPTPLLAAEPRAVSANDKITVAVIGCGIRGKQHAGELARLPDCEVAYVCDPDRDRAAEVAADLLARKRPQPKAVQDLRVILDDKSVAAVFIAVPNHWHALSAIWAMQAGKDVYVEKPVSHDISEGRRMVQVARKTGRICQGGHQYRSSGANRAAVEYMRQGKLGEMKLARSIVYGHR